jgi:hypothetical protein
LHDRRQLGKRGIRRLSKAPVPQPSRPGGAVGSTEIDEARETRGAHSVGKQLAVDLEPAERHPLLGGVLRLDIHDRVNELAVLQHLQARFQAGVATIAL